MLLCDSSFPILEGNSSIFNLVRILPLKEREKHDSDIVKPMSESCFSLYGY